MKRTIRKKMIKKFVKTNRNVLSNDNRSTFNFLVINYTFSVFDSSVFLYFIKANKFSIFF